MPYRDLVEPIDFRSVSFVLIALNVVGILLGYVTTMLLARNLTHEGFEQYIGAIATLGLLSVIGETGFGKYALRAIPAYLAADEFTKLRSYVVFSIVGTIIVSVATAAATFFSEGLLWKHDGRDVIQSAIVMLPLIATAAVVTDLWLSFGRAVSGMVIAKIVIPLPTLLLVLWAINRNHLTPLNAIAYYGAGSLAAIIVSAIAFSLFERPEQDRLFQGRFHFGATDMRPWRSWMASSASYMGFYFLIAWLSRSTLFLASHLPHSTDQLAILTPALETGCLVLLLSKSTDKFFQPAMSTYLQMQRWERLRHMRRTRLKIVGVCVVVFFAILATFGKQILSVYGADFVRGYPSLCVIALGSSVWTLFSLSPSILLYAGAQKTLLRLLAAHGLATMALMAWLFPIYGALGAAIAYSATVSSFAIANFWCANRRLDQLAGL